MSKRSKWQSLSLAWKIIAGLSVVFGLVVSIVTLLQWLGTVDFWNPLYGFFTLSVPLYYFAVLILGVFVVLVLLVLSGSYGSNILDDYYGRHLAILCQEPRTTDYLRRKLDEWKNRDRHHGGYGIDGYLKRLESEGYLKYLDGEWVVSDKALDYIVKYHDD